MKDYGIQTRSWKSSFRDFIEVNQISPNKLKRFIKDQFKKESKNGLSYTKYELDLGGEYCAFFWDDYEKVLVFDVSKILDERVEIYVNSTEYFSSDGLDYQGTEMIRHMSRDDKEEYFMRNFLPEYVLENLNLIEVEPE